jgi:hypothetical protein
VGHGRVDAHSRETLAEVADATSRSMSPKMFEWGTKAYATRAMRDVEALADGLLAAIKRDTDHAHLVDDRFSAFEGVTGVRHISLVNDSTSKPRRSNLPGHASPGRHLRA